MVREDMMFFLRRKKQIRLAPTCRKVIFGGSLAQRIPNFFRANMASAPLFGGKVRLAADDQGKFFRKNLSDVGTQPDNMYPKPVTLARSLRFDMIMCLDCALMFFDWSRL